MFKDGILGELQLITIGSFAIFSLIRTFTSTNGYYLLLSVSQYQKKSNAFSLLWLAEVVSNINMS